jgi:hypothetical protein
MAGGGFRPLCATNVPPAKTEVIRWWNKEPNGICSSPARSFATACAWPQRNGAFARSTRSYLRRVRNELARGDSTEATAQLEARIAATLANKGKQGQVHAQFTLTNSLLQYVLTCVVEPPEEVLPAARARAKARYAKIHRLAGQEVATRNQATLEEVLTHSKKE